MFFLKGTQGPHKVSPSDTVSGEYFDFFPCFALMSNLFEDCSASCCSGSALGSGSRGGSILGLLLLRHPVVGSSKYVIYYFFQMMFGATQIFHLFVVI